MSITSRALLLGTVSLAALSSAATVHAQPSWSWTGSYVGVTAGAAFHHARHTDTDDFLFFGEGFTWRNRHTSPIFGVHGGYNIQSGNIVGGIEADFNVLGSSWTQYPDSFTFVSSQIPWLATIRGRVGVVWNPLLYVTGGIAFADITNRLGATGCCNGIISSSGVRTGFVFGGGVEHKLNPAWIARIEVLFVDFGRRNVSAIIDSKGGPDSFRARFKNSLGILRTGISYQW